MIHIKGKEKPEKDVGVMTIKKLLNDPTHPLSFAIVTLIEKPKKTLNKESDLYYYVLKGEGTFTTEKETCKVKEGDLICIPKNTAYRDEGNLTVLAIANPPFEEENTVFLE